MTEPSKSVNKFHQSPPIGGVQGWGNKKDIYLLIYRIFNS